jgi:ATP adenylyltransferase
MNNERLWAPWRISYIVKDKKEKECIFCLKPNEKKDRENLILYRGSYSFVIMNLYPYNNGHIMVVPYKHISEFEDLSEEEMLDIMKNSAMMIKVLKKVMNPDGFNTGFNIGRFAGAGIAEHLHFHIVPRWAGDTNFMPVVGEIKVISEHIEHTYEKLYKEIRENICKQ